MIGLSCVDEISYIFLAHYTPGPVAGFTYLLFYWLFFGGILIVAAGWSWVLISERDYVGGIRWRARSAALTGDLVLVRRRIRRRSRTAPSKSPEAIESEPAPTDANRRKPRLLVPAYQSPSPSSKTLSVIPTDTFRETFRTLLGASSEDVAYRLVVQIRNTANRHGLGLTDREERRLTRVEELFPGYDGLLD
ncbi:MAG: hypothetical protein ABI130_14510 [Leifsonia sp.]